MKILKSKLKNQSEDLTNNILYSYDNNNASFEEHHEVVFEDPIELVDDIAAEDSDGIEKINKLVEIKNSFLKLNNSLVMSYEKIINGEEEKTTMIEAIEEDIRKKISEYDLFIKDFNSSMKEKGNKIDSLKILILKQSNQLNQIY